MATNCTSEDMGRRRADRDEVLGWVASALRAERLFSTLQAKDEQPEA
jgi:hypothetical protein